MGRSELDQLAAALNPKCMNCHDAKAKTIRGKNPMFCTSSCATQWALRTAMEMFLSWCPRCQVWHNEESRQVCAEEERIAIEDPRIPL